MPTPPRRPIVRVPNHYPVIIQYFIFVLQVLRYNCVLSILLFSLLSYGSLVAQESGKLPLSTQTKQLLQQHFATDNSSYYPAGKPLSREGQTEKENLLRNELGRTLQLLQGQPRSAGSAVIPTISLGFGDSSSGSAFAGSTSDSRESENPAEEREQATQKTQQLREYLANQLGQGQFLHPEKNLPLVGQEPDYAFSYSAQKIKPLNIGQVYGVLLKPRLGRSYADGKHMFNLGNYYLASEIIMESRYTAEALGDPRYLNWLLKSLLAARRLHLIPRYLKQYRLQAEVLREGKEPQYAELYYLVGRYHFALGDNRQAREIFIDYLRQFPGSYYIPNSYYWIARSLEKQHYLEEARAVYLLVVSYYSRHYLKNLAKYKAGTISLYLLKKQAEDFLRSRGVDWQL